MKVNNVVAGANIALKQKNFQNQNFEHALSNGHDEFVQTEASSKNMKMLVVGGLVFVGLSALLMHKASWFKRGKVNDVFKDTDFKNVSDAKEYFEKMGIDTDLRGAKNEHLPLLSRIKENLNRLKEMGVKKDKPESLVVSDWSNTSEYEELCRKKGIGVECKEGYWAFCACDDSGKCHIFINSKHPEFDKFLHEMGHANHQVGKDSYWHAKGFAEHDFADNQLKILGSDDKIYRNQVPNYDLNSILLTREVHSPSKYRYINENCEVRFVQTKRMINKMYSETNCYDGGNYLAEELADMFEGLMQGKNFSDEAMLYYDFAGGARIPNLKISGKTYDEYIESLYNNQELIQKLRENVKISNI